MKTWKSVQDSWRRKAAAGFTVQEALRYFAPSSGMAKTGTMA